MANDDGFDSFDYGQAVRTQSRVEFTNDKRFRKGGVRGWVIGKVRRFDCLSSQDGYTLYSSIETWVTVCTTGGQHIELPSYVLEADGEANDVR
jgi:hypothetical protein